MFARIGKWSVVLALVLATGLHWAALQTVAWTTMLAANLTTSSLAEAVSDTFDGDHPCPLCKQIASGKKSEKPSDTLALKLKLEFPPVAEKRALIPPAPVTALCLGTIYADAFFPVPPSPPPRHLFI